METIFFEKVSKVKRERGLLEKKLKVKITVIGKKVVIEGPTLEEYEATMVLEAVKFGFSVNSALLILDEDMQFRRIGIKKFTRRKDLKLVRSRIIGTYGGTKRTIEEISGCELIINEEENAIGIIGRAEDIDNATTALTNLIRGSKQANVYRFLERMNRSQKEEGLGLKYKKNNKK